MITNKSNLSNASAIYRKLFDDVFLGANESSHGNWKNYCKEETVTGTSYEFNFLNELPMPREWKGEKEFKATRANKHRIDVKPYEASTSIEVVQFDQNPMGVGQTIRSWLSAAAGFINGLVVAKFLTGDTDTCYDGVSLFNTAHPNGPNGSTQSNRTTNALDAANYRAAKAAMRAFKDGSGRGLGVRPDLLMVGPAKEDLAKEILVARSRVVGMAADGTQDGGTRVAAASIENVSSQDGVGVMVEPLVSGGSSGNGSDTSYWWFVIDSRLSPMIVATAKAPTPSDDVDDYKPGAAEHHFSIEAQLAIGYGIWQGVHANLSTT